MAPPSNVTTFPSPRLKMAVQLRQCADRLMVSEDDTVGEALLLQLDADGIIHTTWMLDNHNGRMLRMIGVLEIVRHQLLEAVRGCGCDTPDEADDGPTN